MAGVELLLRDAGRQCARWRKRSAGTRRTTGWLPVCDVSVAAAAQRRFHRRLLGSPDRSGPHDHAAGSTPAAARDRTARRIAPDVATWRHPVPHLLGQRRREMDRGGELQPRHHTRSGWSAASTTRSSSSPALSKTTVTSTPTSRSSSLPPLTDLRDAHELYCAGHLIEAGVAHFEATGNGRPLDVVARYADTTSARCSGGRRVRSAGTTVTRKSSWRW